MRIFKISLFFGNCDQRNLQYTEFFGQARFQICRKPNNGVYFRNVLLCWFHPANNSSKFLSGTAGAPSSHISSRCFRSSKSLSGSSKSFRSWRNFHTYAGVSRLRFILFGQCCRLEFWTEINLWNMYLLYGGYKKNLLKKQNSVYFYKLKH